MKMSLAKTVAVVASLCFSNCTGVADERKDISPGASAQWDKATEPFSISEMEVYAQKYSRGKHATEAKQILADEKVIEGIIQSGPGERFVVPKDCLPEFVSKSCQYHKQRGRTVLEGTPGVPSAQFSAMTVFGNVSFSVPETIASPQELQTKGIRGPFLPCGNRSVFVISGGAQNIVGDAKAPIRFVYLADKGLVYIGGKGKVLSPEGKVIFKTQ